MFKKSFLLAMVFIWLAFLGRGVSSAEATIRCEQQYAGEVCVRIGNLEVDKKVWDPKNQRFVDNLNATDHKFAPGEEVVFQIRVKNVGDADFDKVTFTDTLPSFLELSSGSLSADLGSLKVGETKEVEIKARVKGRDFLPSEPTVICEVNIAEARAGEETQKDTAQICVSKKPVEAVVLPVTGPEDFSLILSLCLVAGVSGVALVVLSRR